jgi:zinc transport system ATP-binding protein
MQGPAIEFERVNLTLGATAILEDVSFKIRASTIHCIVGANGGGKTSLVRSLLGQMPHTGSISIGWHDNKVIGYVPQSLDFDKSLPITVRDFMAMATQRRPVFLGVSRARRAEIERTLEQLGLSGKLGTTSRRPVSTSAEEKSWSVRSSNSCRPAARPCGSTTTLRRSTRSPTR